MTLGGPCLQKLVRRLGISKIDFMMYFIAAIMAYQAFFGSPASSLIAAMWLVAYTFASIIDIVIKKTGCGLGGYTDSIYLIVAMSAAFVVTPMTIYLDWSPGPTSC